MYLQQQQYITLTSYFMTTLIINIIHIVLYDLHVFEARVQHDDQTYYMSLQKYKS